MLSVLSLYALLFVKVMCFSLSLLPRVPVTFAAPAELPRAASPEVEGIHPEALKQLLQGAEASHSSAVVILKNGKLVGEWSFGKAPARIEAMSVTKSVAGLAVLKLLADGKIPSLDVPLHTYFPEWNQGRKKDITLRHLLTHTSGLQGPLVGFNSNGDLGQYLVVVPEQRLVAVRMYTPPEETRTRPDESVYFDDFIPRALALVGIGPPSPAAQGAATSR